jgi:hypothetical protein
MPDTTGHEDAVQRVRGYLLNLFEHTPARERPRHIWHLARLVGRDMSQAREMVIGESNVEPERLLREARLILLRDADRLRKTSGRLEFAEEWLALGAEAARRVAREDRWAERYAALPQDAEEDAFVDAGSAAAGERWQTD